MINCVRWSLVGLCVALLTPCLTRAAVRGNEAMYVGGTSANISEKTEGKLDLSDQSVGRFIAKKGEIAIPYAQITSLEYGQKAGRRVGVALAISPVALFSKKRRHYLTIGYSDAKGAKQGVVLELAKGTVHRVTSILETKSGKKVEFESGDAKKHFEKGTK